MTENKQCDCGCENKDKPHMHCEMMKIWDDIPDNIKDMVHSLLTQKMAVLKEVHKWAKETKHTELAEICERKIEKTTKKIEQMQEE